MSMSGVEVPTECISRFNEMKMHTGDQASMCIAYRISDNLKTFEIYKRFEKDSSKSQEAQYEEIIEELGNVRDIKGNKVPFVLVWDLELPPKVQATQGQAESSPVPYLVVMSLCLELELPVSSRMLFATSKKSLKDKLKGVPYSLEVMCREDAKYDSVLSALKVKTKTN